MSKYREIFGQNEDSNDSQKTLILNDDIIASINAEKARPVEVPIDNHSTSGTKSGYYKKFADLLTSLSIIKPDSEQFQINKSHSFEIPGTSFNDSPLAAPIVPKAEIEEDPLLMDHINRLEMFGMEISKKATYWRQIKETNFSTMLAVLKETDKEWKNLMIKFEFEALVNADDGNSGAMTLDPATLVPNTEADFLKNINEVLESDMDELSNDLENNSPLPEVITVKPDPDYYDNDDDDAVDLSMFKKEPLEAELEPDTTSVLNDKDYVSLISESEDENTTEAPARNRVTRKIKSEAELAAETKAAQKAEVQREKRLNKMRRTIKKLLSQNRDLDNEFVLDYDKKNSQAITVHPDIAKNLKPHQKEGVRFMYNNCYGPIDDIEKYPGSGCILAHCMGLGKTLQLIALLHTIIHYPRLKTNKILVLCPKSTIMNWFEEFERWISTIKKTRKMKVFCYEENMTIKEKTKILLEWHECGDHTGPGKAGCLLLGYETFRSMVNYKPREKNVQAMDESEIMHIQDTIEKCLIEPGADIVICDEGHVIKNSRSGISKAVSQIKTKRRIILTGTPIQNNLNEYYCMVNWIKPSFLGTEKEFNNRYANPIKQGQHKDSTSTEIRQMKRRSFVLHRKLQPFVERKEFTILKDELPKKHEYVVYVPLTEVQTRLYKIYLEHLKKSRLGKSEKIKGTGLLPDYTFLRKIWTHPRVLESAFETSRKNQNKKATNLDELIKRWDKEDLPDDVFDIGETKIGGSDKWWDRFLEPEDLDTLVSSYKMQLMIEILRQCNEMGDKCVIFSNFVAVLTVVEHFLKTHLGYLPGHNYYRLDGQTPKAKRHTMITRFNRADNQDVKCFLISARAGGQGINLIGANRVIILDTSWNPAADLQSIFRVFRLGQKKTCYVYRLLAFGTMEEKVYSRSVTKQAMSNRVVDEMQVDRHFSYGELAELYTLTEYDMEKRPMPGVPVDSVLKNLLRSDPIFIYKFHEHDSLLASKNDEELSEQEKADAWKALEDEEKETNNPNPLKDMSMDTNDALLETFKSFLSTPNVKKLLNSSATKKQATKKVKGVEMKKKLLAAKKLATKNPAPKKPVKKPTNSSPAAKKRKPTASTSQVNPLITAPFINLSGFQTEPSFFSNPTPSTSTSSTFFPVQRKQTQWQNNSIPPTWSPAAASKPRKRKQPAKNAAKKLATKKPATKKPVKKPANSSPAAKKRKPTASTSQFNPLITDPFINLRGPQIGSPMFSNLTPSTSAFSTFFPGQQNQTQEQNNGFLRVIPTERLIYETPTSSSSAPSSNFADFLDSLNKPKQHYNDDII